VTDFLQDHSTGQIVAADEMSLYFQATTTRVWSAVGQTPQVWVSPQREHIHYYGAINLRTGHEMALPLPELSSETSAHFFEHVIACCGGRHLLLLLDRATWHKGDAVRMLLARHPEVEVIWFPPGCPELNPQEHVWSQARAAVSHNHAFYTFDALKKAFLNYLSDTLFPFDWLSKYAPPILLCQS
jgi:transposase